MKKIVLVGMVLCMLLGNVGCNTNKDSGDQDNIVNESITKDKQQNEKENNTEDNYTDDDIQTGDDKQIEPMNDSDLTVTDGENNITLDARYDDFKTTDKELDVSGSENNYVGEIYMENDIMYKVFSHEYNDFTLYSSNINYDNKEAESDTYYIMQMVIHGDQHETARGICVGDTTEDVYKVYGEGSEEDKVDDTYQYGTNSIVDDYQIIGNVTYSYKNYSLQFIFDKENIIREINLVVNPIGKLDPAVYKEDDVSVTKEEASSLDLLDYLAFNKEEFIDKTGIQVERGPEGDEYEYYTGYDQNLQIYFEEESVLMIQFYGDVEGYNLLGLSCGMTFKEAIKELNKRGLDYKYEENSGDYEVSLNKEKSASLYISTENSKVVSLFYSVNEIY